MKSVYDPRVILVVAPVVDDSGFYVGLGYSYMDTERVIIAEYETLVGM